MNQTFIHALMRFNEALASKGKLSQIRAEAEEPIKPLSLKPEEIKHQCAWCKKHTGGGADRISSCITWDLPGLL